MLLLLLYYYYYYLFSTIKDVYNIFQKNPPTFIIFQFSSLVMTGAFIPGSYETCRRRGRGGGGAVDPRATDRTNTHARGTARYARINGEHRQRQRGSL